MLTIFSRRRAFQTGWGSGPGATAIVQLQQTPATRQPGDQALAAVRTIPREQSPPHGSRWSTVTAAARMCTTHWRRSITTFSPILKTKKYVIIKPNNVGASMKGALSASNPDELHGVLELPRAAFQGPHHDRRNPRRAIPSRPTRFWSTPRWSRKHRDQKVTLVDLNREAKIKVLAGDRLQHPRCTHPPLAGADYSIPTRTSSAPPS